MTVSVIIPVYNASRTLADALRSVLAQTYAGIEVVCVDDGSTDDSSHILSEWAERDARLKVITTSNRGTLAARKTAVSESKGDWILFLDPDDRLEKEAVRTFLDVADKSGADVIQCGMLLEETSQVAKEWRRAMDIYFNRPALTCSAEEALDRVFTHRNLPWNLIGKFVRGDVARRAFSGHADVVATMSEDACSMFRILLHAGNIKVIESKLYRYRIGGGISTRERLSVDEVCRGFGVFKEFDSLRILCEERSRKGVPPPSCMKDFSASIEDAVFSWVFDRLKTPEEQTVALEAWRREVGEIRFSSILHGLYSRLSRATADAARAIGELQAIENSRSYKIGRIATAPLRMIAALFKSAGKKRR